MSEIAISIQNLSKKYIIGRGSSGSLRETIVSAFSSSRNSTTEEFWALKDVSFDIKRGDAIGIVGKNGAGKSTLLKLLSRITEPTLGRIEIDGRISALLEVGTGFHPELTGRENVFLNGTVLGMRRTEIKARFDEIVEFSGVEKFLDTPVKRYSSGMKVRLAFAVAAHLEPEILIIDEVLAVGDAEFQKKCLGKMEHASNEGRTVIFVSHNMGAVKSLCQKGILLKNGQIIKMGTSNEVVNHYLESAVELKGRFLIDAPRMVSGSELLAYATELAIEDANGKLCPVLPIAKPWQIRVKFTVLEKISHFIIAIGFKTMEDLAIRSCWSTPREILPGEYEAVFKEDVLYFTSGTYKLVLGLSSREKAIQYIEECAHIEFDEYVDKDVALNTKSGLFLNQMEVSIAKS